MPVSGSNSRCGGRSSIPAKPSGRPPTWCCCRRTGRGPATKSQNNWGGPPPSEDEVAGGLNLPRKKFNLIKKALRVYNAIPHAAHEENIWLLEEGVPDDRSPTPERQMVEGDDLHQVLHLLDQMDKREATVIRLRFGLAGEEPKTLQEIGERLSLTRERVRQIENEALNHLQECMLAE